jgi:hypothetical protein
MESFGIGNSGGQNKNVVFSSVNNILKDIKDENKENLYQLDEFP